MPTYTGLSGKTYQTKDAPFAGGGEGDIYDIIGNMGLVAKIYNPERRIAGQERKIAAMISSQPAVIDQYAWPLDVLYENSEFVGFTMTKIEGKEKLRNLYVYDKRVGRPWPLFVNIAKNLSAAVYNVHEIGQIIGDLNPENILVDPQSGLITLIDTDSYHITDEQGNVHRCGVGMPEFVAPELQGKHFPSECLPTFTKESDEFSLSVLIFALLMNGAHPFACKTLSGSSSKFQPVDNLVQGLCAFFETSRNANTEIPRYTPPIQTLPPDIQGLFFRAFVEGHEEKDSRPIAEEWYHALERLERHNKSCLNNPAHFYYKYAMECPWCVVDEKMGKRVERKKSTIGQSAFKGESYSGSGTTASLITTASPVNVGHSIAYL